MHASLVNSTSCRLGGPGHALPHVHSSPVLAQLSPATWVADGVLRCASPPAKRAGALGVWRYDFGAAPLPGLVSDDARFVPDHDTPCPMGEALSRPHTWRTPTPCTSHAVHC